MQLLSTEHFPSRPNRNLPKNTTRGMPEQARNFDIWDSTVTILNYPLGQGIRSEKTMDTGTPISLLTVHSCSKVLNSWKFNRTITQRIANMVKKSS